MTTVEEMQYEKTLVRAWERLSLRNLPSEARTAPLLYGVSAVYTSLLHISFSLLF